jgi:GxxExxY protein
MEINELSGCIIGLAVEVHKQVGPGLLESVYHKCLEYELINNGLSVESEVALPVTYKALRFQNAYKIDLVVESMIVIELKAVEKVLPVHGAQLLSYLKLSKYELGLLINFNVPRLTSGVKRIINPLCASVSPCQERL